MASVFCFLVYIVCGFFVRPVAKYPFLSVASVAGLLVLAFILYAITSSGRSDAYAFSIYNVNPTMLGVGVLFGSSIISSILFFLSPLLPSLLMYGGMMLRKLLRSWKQIRGVEGDFTRVRV